MTKVIRSHAIARHQEPAGEAGFDRVKAVARGGLCDLNYPFVDIPVQLSMQGPVLPMFAAEARGCHAQGRSGSLYQGAHRRIIYPERHRNPEHAFAANQADFQRHVSLYQREQGHQRVAGKVDMPDRLPRLIEDLAESQRDRLETGQQTLIFLARQGRKQAVCNRNSVHVLMLYREIQQTRRRQDYNGEMTPYVRLHTEHPGAGRNLERGPRANSRISWIETATGRAP